jgi:hypothetical protein
MRWPDDVWWSGCSSCIGPNPITACSFGWWLMAGAGLFWEKSTVGWLLLAGLFCEKSTVGWWLISQTNKASCFIIGACRYFLLTSYSIVFVSICENTQYRLGRFLQHNNLVLYFTNSMLVKINVIFGEPRGDDGVCKGKIRMQVAPSISVCVYIYIYR